MIYLEYFGLREAPFGITPHTDFFFAGAKRGAVLEALVYAITQEEGIVKVSGEVGSGKTLLCRMLLERLSGFCETIYLAMPSLSYDDVLHVMADELRIERPGSRTRQLMNSLRTRLLEIYASGRRVVVLIDEAHAMPAETLEGIRLLSNLESARHKLLHIVLFGQPELDERLGKRDMRQLKDRITHSFMLEPFHRADIGDYLEFRLRAAGYCGPNPFTPRAVRLIARASQGLSRRINVLADKSLLAAFSEGQYQVNARQARAAIRDARVSPMGEERGKFALVIGHVIAIVIGIALAVLLGGRVGMERSAKIEKPATEAMEATTRRTPTLGERIAATEEWLKNTPNTHHFIQFLSTSANNLSDVQLLVDELSARLDPRQIRVYRSRLSGSDRLGVIYGDFASRAEAEIELKQVRTLTPAGTPYVRAVGKLR
jgi:type II secretory pathway predicted ATPase ExeA